MAAVALSPWPATPAALAKARACLREAVAGAGGLSDDRVDTLGATASALVERYAAGAPVAVKNEATIRTAGWLHGRPKSGETWQEIGDILNRRWPAGHKSALRHSGAMALLSPWKTRRAGAIG